MSLLHFVRGDLLDPGVEVLAVEQGPRLLRPPVELPATA